MGPTCRRPSNCSAVCTHACHWRLHSEVLRGASDPGCELLEVVDSKGFFDALNLGDALLESFVTQYFVLVLLHPAPERLDLRGSEQRAESREENGIFAGFVRPVHANELRAERHYPVA